MDLENEAENNEYILCAAIHFKNGAPATVQGIESGVIISGRIFED